MASYIELVDKLAFLRHTICLGETSLKSSKVKHYDSFVSGIVVEQRHLDAAEKMVQSFDVLNFQFTSGKAP